MLQQATTNTEILHREKEKFSFNLDKRRNIGNIVNMSPTAKPLTRVIAVTSGKGGVGKSTLCVNLSISLAKRGCKVLLLDGDLGLANVNVLMGIIPDFSLYDVVRKKKRLRDIVISTNFGIDIIAGANGISQLADIDQGQRESFLSQLEELEGYDIVMLDTGAGIGTNVVSLAMASHEILVVTTPEPTAITDAYAMIKSIIVHDENKSVNLLVNRAPSALEAKRVADRLKSITSRFLNVSIESLGFILEEDLVQKSIRSQRPLVSIYPGSKSSACINQIGSQIHNQKKTVKAGGLQLFFQNLMGKKDQNQLGLL